MTVKANMFGGCLHFIGTDAERITKIRKSLRATVKHEALGKVSYYASDLQSLAEDIIAEGWKLSVHP